MRRPAPSPESPARQRAAAWLVLSLLFIAPATWVGAQPAPTVVTGVEVEPLLPTFLDQVRVTVHGTSRYAITAPRNPVRIVADGRVLQLVLVRGSELVPPRPTPFAVTFQLPLLPPDDYQLQVIEERNDGVRTVAGKPLSIYAPGHFIIEPVDPPLTDDSVTRLRIIGWDVYCPKTVDSTVEGDVLDLRVIFECGPTELPPPGLTVLEHDVGVLPAGDYRVGVRAPRPSDFTLASRGEFSVYRAGGCIPSATELCLNDDRFRVSVSWRDFQEGEGEGVAIPVPDRDDTGMFWFFNQNNVELTVKVLNGCGVNGHFWVFVSPGSTVDWELTVTDTLRNETRTYENALGEVPALIPDTTAFATCP